MSGEESNNEITLPVIAFKYVQDCNFKAVSPSSGTRRCALDAKVAGITAGVLYKGTLFIYLIFLISFKILKSLHKKSPVSAHRKIIL